MNRKLQQRLLGTVVIAAFVLLIAPVLLDAEGRIPEKITSIPPQPKRPDLSHIRAVEPAQDLLPELPSPETVDSLPAVLETEPVKETDLWSVQVASFRDVSKASAFRNRLREQQYQVYLREKLLSDGSLFTQVFVGPVNSKNEAEQLKEAIKRDFGEQGLVVTYRLDSE